MQKQVVLFPARRLATSLKSLSLNAAAFGIAALTTSALAQEAPKVEDVVVTARFRQESVQRTPLSVTAFTGDQLIAKGVARVDDITASAPGVTLQQNTGGFGKSALAFIRGVGQNDALPAFEPGVGVYIDDIYHGTLQGALYELTDIGQIEILRGPQGTLFGKNNEGGAIRISSTKPRGDNSGFIEAGVGSFDRLLFKGAFDMGIIPDVLALRVSGGVSSYDGYVKMIDFVCAHPTQAGSLPRTIPLNQEGNCVAGGNGGSDTKALKANLLYTPNAALEINLVGDLADDNGQPTGEKLLAVNTNPPSALAGFGPGAPGYGDPAATTFGVPYDARFITDNPYTTYSTYTDPRTGQTFPRVSNLRSWGVAGNVSWKLGPDVTLTSITGYRSYNAEYIEIWGNAPIHINDNYFKPEHTQFTQELRLNGTLANHFADWTVGGYYYDADTALNAFIYLPEVSIFNVFDPKATKPGLNFYGRDPVKDTDKSAFAHLVLHPTEAFSLEGGLRYSDVAKQYTFNRFIPPGFPFYPVLPGFESNPTIHSATDRFDYRLSAQYQWTPELMTYATFTTGFKGPGVNPRPNAAADLVRFEEEDLKSYEVGAKSQFFDNRMRLNVSAFRSDYSNLQLSVVNVGAPGSTVSNAGKVRIQGVEGELRAEPISDFWIDASVGFIDFEYLELGAAAGVPDGPCLSCTAPFTPRWQTSLGVQYRIDLQNLGSVTPRLDWSYRAKTYNDLANTTIASSDAYSLLNARLGYETKNGDWGLALEVRNLADKVYYVNKFNQLNSAGLLVGQVGAPRTFLLALRRNFK